MRSLQAVVNETHEVYDIDADDLRDLLERLEVRIGAR
jgi:CBS-domain-containing membrane protein